MSDIAAWGTRSLALDGYVRVSQTRGRAGERFISPLVQRQQIEGWAQLHGVTLGIVFEELDESGARADRPMLLAALERVEQRQSDGIIVAKLDRFGRSLLDSLAAIERIRAVGGTFVSVQDGFDVSTDTGKLVLRFMLSMAEWELDRIRSQWSAARERAVLRGVHMGARPPTGYQRGADGRLTPHPVAGPVITEAFRLRAGGASLVTVSAAIRAGGVTSSAGGTRWEADVIRTLLRNRVYLGELSHGRVINEAAHEALVAAETWHAAQSPRSLHQGRTSPALLAGLLRCASCRQALHQQSVPAPGGRSQRVYFCKGQSAGGRCPGRVWIAGRLVESYIESTFFSLLRQRPRLRAAQDVMAEQLAELPLAREDLVVFRDEPGIMSTLGSRRYEEGLAIRIRREEQLCVQIAAQRDRASAEHEIDAEHCEREWPQWSPAARRAMIARLIECAFVTRGGRGAAGRVFACERGSGPADLPRRGYPQAPRSFDPQSCRRVEPANRELNKLRWPARRIDAELRVFLAAQPGSGWPVDDAFLDAGRGPLLRQIRLGEGQLRWAARLGLERRRWPRGATGPTTRSEEPSGASWADGRTSLPVLISPRGDWTAFTQRWAGAAGRCGPRSSACDSAALSHRPGDGTRPASPTRWRGSAPAGRPIHPSAILSRRTSVVCTTRSIAGTAVMRHGRRGWACAGRTPAPVHAARQSRLPNLSRARSRG